MQTAWPWEVFSGHKAREVEGIGGGRHPHGLHRCATWKHPSQPTVGTTLLEYSRVKIFSHYFKLFNGSWFVSRPNTMCYRDLESPTNSGTRNSKD